MPSLNIHVETFDEDSFLLIKKCVGNGPVALSFAPWQLSKLSNKQISWLSEVLTRDEYVLGQQGLRHKCSQCVDFQNLGSAPGVDPWHENACLWFPPVSASVQEEFMRKGKEQLESVFNKPVELYVPPNHYFDKNTVTVAKGLGYSWLSDRASSALLPFSLNGLLIVPEAEPAVVNGQVYIHADRWRGDLDRVLKEGLVSFHALKLSRSRIDVGLVKINRKKKYVSKIARDFHGGFNMSFDNAQLAAELVYNAHLANSNLL